ncbi:MAG: N-acetylmuramoyl-L-alanine amidase [Bacteroidetes bacterium]|nr:N-acetylmuramoyl-L-alanine amidase [Bacteroidota bacterium]
MKYFHSITFILILIFSFTAFPAFAQKKFTVVIDAGHGGHDSGAVGRYSKEKNINLAVSLALGKKIEENYPDVKVVYTREKDFFLTLQERADIVNRNNADIFFCIHTNANNSSTAFGAETYTLGLHKSQSNLDVAMRENSVITLEDNYKTKYQGFDPSSPDTYIMFEFMQDKYIDKSIELASTIQNQFVQASRYDRGVRQAGFWVLHKSACPSVLVELGFISNQAEEDFLNTNEGRDQMANSIFKAFEIYKRQHDKKSGIKVTPLKNDEAPNQNNEIENTENQTAVSTSPKTDSTKAPAVKETPNTKAAKAEPVAEKSKNQIVFKIQLLAVDYKLRSGSEELKGLKNTDYYREGKYYKYTYGEETDYNEINKLRKSISRKFPRAYIIAFKNGEKIPIKDSMKK